MYIWTPASIAFRRDAESYYHISGQIAEHLKGILSTEAYICDAGCGLGYLSLALARDGFRVDAIDCSQDALAILREEAGEVGPPSLQILETDLFEYHPREFYTDMVFSFFGSTEEIIHLAKQQCKGQIHIIRKSWKSREIGTSDGFVDEGSQLQNCTLLALIRELDRRSIPYREHFFEAETGQPFRTASDAALFFMLYGQEETLLQPEEVIERLTPTGDSVFPYCLPSRRELGILTIDVNTLRQEY